MYTANLPGFTAETSCDTPRDRYSSTAQYGEPSAQAVSPQLLPVGLGDTGSGGTGGGGDEPECILRCYWQCGRYGCFPTRCYWLCF
jgi:hypothetical protein